MKTKYENGILSFEEMPNEKVFCVTGTVHGDGDRFVRLMTEEEVKKEMTTDEDDWSMPLDQMEVGDTSTYHYWYYDKANVIVRLA